MDLETMADRYVITTAQRGASPHRTFLANLNRFASEHDAELLILPTNGKKPTSKKSLDDEEFIHPDLMEYPIIDGDIRLHKHLDIRRFPVKAQQIDPITGWARFVQYDRSAIYASPKQRMMVVPNSNTDMPKVLMTTGAVTMPNYRDGNWDTKAALDHVFGAIYVETDGDLFHYRQLQANTTGRFFDLGKEYTHGKKGKTGRADALVLGDLHTGHTDPHVMETTYELMKKLKPKALVVHDLFGGTSISHHNQQKLVHRAKIVKQGKDSLYDELYACGEILEQLLAHMPKDGKMYIVKSNHDEWIDRYLEEGRFATDPKNLELSCMLAQDMLNGFDPLESGIAYTFGELPRVKFLSRKSDLKVRGYQLANHGDLGANGSRGSVRSIENATGKSIVGHSHSPQIQRNVVYVGTSTHLDMEYNRGASSWLNTHGVIHPHGRPQLVNIIEGRYKSGE